MNERPRHPDLAAFIRDHVLKRGDFVLSSGQTSTYYIDGKLASFHPVGSWLITEAILKELEELGADEFDAVGGMDMGATPIVAAVANRGYALGWTIPAFVVRKAAKDHGMRKRIEGPLSEEMRRVVVIDDTVSTGGSIIQAIDAVEAGGYEVVLAISVVDREAGAADRLKERKIAYRPLITLADIGVTHEQGDSNRSPIRTAAAGG